MRDELFDAGQTNVGQDRDMSKEEVVAKHTLNKTTSQNVKNKAAESATTKDANAAARSAEIAAHPKNWNKMSQRQKAKWNKRHRASK